MDLLRKALNEALARNADGRDRWTKYRDEHRQAADNLDLFRKSLEVDILIPLGNRKALTPGKLVHTNEILISHSRNLFSNCTAFQAIKICEKRIESANERLKDLEIERNMYQNKLDMPGFQNAFSASGEEEIIEDYDEETERQWRIKHQRSVREQKLRERSERERRTAQKAGGLDKDVLDMFDELELMEELEMELESLEMTDELGDERVRRLLNGEIQLPGDRPRRAHGAKEKHADVAAKMPSTSVAKKPAVVEQAPIVEAVPEESTTDSDDQSTDGEDSSSDDENSDDCAEFQPTSDNLTNGELISFYKSHVSDLEKLMRQSKPVSCVEDLELRTDRLFAVDRLQRRIDRLLRLPSDAKATIATKSDEAANLNGKRNVSFGADEIASFSKHQPPRRVSKDLRAAAADDSDTSDDESQTGENTISPQKRTKSILKNKEAVAEEIHRPIAKAVPEAVQQAAANNSEHLVEFKQILGDIFERSVTSETTDAITSTDQPNRRISKFKANRRK